MTCVHFYRKRWSHPVPMLTIHSVQMNCRPVIKFLCPTFDRDLTWNAHVDDLTARCKSSLNAIRCISHITRRVDRDVYCACRPRWCYIKLITDAQCTLQPGGRAWERWILFTTQECAVLQLCSQSLYREAGMMCLHLRPELLLLRYVLKF